MFQLFNTLFGNRIKGKPFIDDNDLADLNRELQEITNNINQISFSCHDTGTSLFLVNIHELMQIIKDSDLLWNCVQFLEKASQNEENRFYIAKRLHFLPILSELLSTRDEGNKKKYLLRLINDLSVETKIRNGEDFIGKLFGTLTPIIMADDHDLSVLALSILLNLCQQNAAALRILRTQINYTQLMKRVTIGQYGLLACKLNLVLDQAGHNLIDADIRNFLNYLNAEISSAISSSNPETLKQIISFFKKLLEVDTSRSLICAYSFHKVVESVEKFLSGITKNKDATRFSKFLFELITILIQCKNKSFKILYPKLVDAAVSLADEEAFNLLYEVFERDQNNSVPNPDSLHAVLNDVLQKAHTKTRKASAALRLLTVMPSATHILTDELIKTIIDPFLNENTRFTNLHADQITMFLHCLSAGIQFSTKTKSLLNQESVQYILAMSIKHGDSYQVKLALELFKESRNTADYISKIIANVPRDENANKSADSTLLGTTLLNHTMGTTIAPATKTDNNKELSSLIIKLNEAISQNKLHQVNISDYLKIYEAQTAIYRQKASAQQIQINEYQRQIMSLNQRELLHENLIASQAEINQMLQIAKEKLQTENENNSKVLKKGIVEQSQQRKKIEVLEATNATQTKAIAECQMKNKKLQQRVDELEHEAEIDEDTRIKIMHLMSKRKK